MNCSVPSFPVLHYLPEFAQTHDHWVSDASNHLLFCHPLLLLPSMFPSVRVFSSGSALCIRRPKYRGFSFSTSPSNEYSGLISFRVDWLDLLAVQGTLKSFLQHHSSLGLPKKKTALKTKKSRSCLVFSLVYDTCQSKWAVEDSLALWEWLYKRKEDRMDGMDKRHIGTVWQGHGNTQKEVCSLLSSFHYHLCHFTMDED